MTLGLFSTRAEIPAGSWRGSQGGQESSSVGGLGSIEAHKILFERNTRMSEADKRNRPFPTSQKGDKIDHGTDALAGMNQNKGVIRFQAEGMAQPRG